MLTAHLKKCRYYNNSFLGSTPGVPSIADNLRLSDVIHYMYGTRKANADSSGESMSCISMNIDFPESRSVRDSAHIIMTWEDQSRKLT